MACSRARATGQVGVAGPGGKSWVWAAARRSWRRADIVLVLRDVQGAGVGVDGGVEDALLFVELAQGDVIGGEFGLGREAGVGQGRRRSPGRGAGVLDRAADRPQRSGAQLAPSLDWWVAAPPGLAPARHDAGRAVGMGDRCEAFRVTVGNSAARSSATRAWACAISGLGGGEGLVGDHDPVLPDRPGQDRRTPSTSPCGSAASEGLAGAQSCGFLVGRRASARWGAGSWARQGSRPRPAHSRAGPGTASGAFGGDRRGHGRRLIRRRGRASGPMASRWRARRRRRQLSR